MVRVTSVLAVLLAAALAGTPALAQQRLVTYGLPSAWVDPATVKFNSPPPGAPARPNALRVNVLLPEGYTSRSTQSWPLLLLLHGHGDAYDSWANPRRGNLLALARGLGAIIVMPEAATGWYTDWWNGGTRGAPGWERYHLDELLPWIEQTFRIRAGRRWHAVAGFSMGGEGAAYYASQRPDYFGTLATFSGTLSLQRPEWPSSFDSQGESHQAVYGDPEAQRFYWTGHNPTALAPNLRFTRTYVAVGDGVPQHGEASNTLGSIAEADLRQHAQDFVAALRGAHADVTYAPRGGIHDWPYWREDFSRARRWDLFSPRVPERSPREWSFTTVRRHSNAWGLHVDFAQPPASVATFVRSEERLRASGLGSVTVTTPEGASLSASLPFDVTLPRLYDVDVPVALRAQVAAARRAGAPRILLPATLRAPVSAPPAAGRANARGYVFLLGDVGAFSARRAARLAPGGARVALVRGRRGRVYLPPAGSSARPGIAWTESGARYVINARPTGTTNARDYLLALANAAIRAGARR